MRSIRVQSLLWVVLAFAMAMGLAANASNDGPRRVSVAPGGAMGNDSSFGPVSLTSDGFLVTYSSDASNLYALDRNDERDVFASSRDGRFTRMVSVGENNIVFNGASEWGSVSANGSAFAFQSTVVGFGNPDGNGKQDIFIKSAGGPVVLASQTVAGAQGNDESSQPSMAGSGGSVAFTSAATNLIGSDSNGKLDVFLSSFDFNRGVRSLVRISERQGGIEANDDSEQPSASFSGNRIAFTSSATNLISSGDNNGQRDVYVKDRITGEVILVSASLTGVAGNGSSRWPAISADGKFVAFLSSATNLVENDTNGATDVFLRDLENGITWRASVGPNGAQSNDASGANSTPVGGRPAISADGRFVAYTSLATNLSDEDNNGVAQAYLFDRDSGGSRLVSLNADGEAADEEISSVAISGSGDTIAFVTEATNLIEGDPSGMVSQVYTVRVDAAVGANQSPTADAGEDQEAFEGEFVILDATGSSDPEGEPLTFFWRQITDGDGPIADLSDPTSPTPDFIAPGVVDTTDLVFEVTVSDGVSEPDSDRVIVTVFPGPTGVVEGRVIDENDFPISGARIEVVRLDGQAAPVVFTDAQGRFQAGGVRQGTNLITAYAAGFEPVSELIEVGSGEVVEIELVVSELAAVVSGSVRLSDGSGLAGALVELLDSSGEVLNSSVTDSSGQYAITDVTQEQAQEAVTARVTHPGAITWVREGLSLFPGELNFHDFLYGALTVKVDTRPKRLRKQLNGTEIELLLDGEVVITAAVGKNNRKVVFPNVPAQNIRVVAVGPNLRAEQQVVSITPGGRKNKVKLILRDPTTF